MKISAGVHHGALNRDALDSTFTTCYSKGRTFLGADPQRGVGIVATDHAVRRSARSPRSSRWRRWQTLKKRGCARDDADRILGYTARSPLRVPPRVKTHLLITCASMCYGSLRDLHLRGRVLPRMPGERQGRSTMTWVRTARANSVGRCSSSRTTTTAASGLSIDFLVRTGSRSWGAGLGSFFRPHAHAQDAGRRRGEGIGRVQGFQGYRFGFGVQVPVRVRVPGSGFGFRCGVPGSGFPVLVRVRSGP